MQTDPEGQALAPGATSSLVAHLDLLSADGQLYLSAETLPITTFVDHGLVKNPGPGTVHVLVINDGQSEQFELLPGDGLAVNIEELAEVLDTSNSRIVCKCRCRGNGYDVPITFNCDGSPPGNTNQPAGAPQNLDQLLACDCSNADNFTCDFDVDDDGVNEIVDGDVANCKTKITNN